MHTNYYDSFENQLRHENSEIIDILEDLKTTVAFKIIKTTDTSFFDLNTYMQHQRAIEMVKSEIKELKVIPAVREIFEFNAKYPSFNNQSLAKFYEGVTIN